MESVWNAPHAVASSREKAPQVTLSPALFDPLFDRYYRSVVYFFARRGVAAEECHDHAQETFLRVYMGMERLRDADAARSYLFTTAANLWRNEIRNHQAAKRRGTEVALDESTLSPRPGTRGDSLALPLGSAIAHERAKLVRAALERLPPRMRRCVLLRLDQDLKYREIAVIMQVSVDTVKAQLHQARQRLEEILGEHFDASDF
jgi:RNA polymerase sigma factor (sigma-70 family)